MFACRDATHLVTDAREGSLSGVLRFRYGFHMLICPHCKAFRRQLEETIAVAKEVAQEEQVAPEAVDRAMEAFRARKPAQ
jgi:hypothetical protein